MASIQLRNPRKLIIVLVCLVLAFVIVFVGLPNLDKKERAVVQVVRVRESVKKDMLIEENMLKMVEVGEWNLPSDAIMDYEMVVGKYSTVELLPSDNLVPDKFTDFPYKEDAFMYEYEKDQRVNVSISLSSIAASVSGKLESGDIVEVLVYKKGITDYETGTVIPDSVISYEELAFVEVASVTNNKTEDVVKIKDNLSESDEKAPAGVNENIIPSTVILRCYPVQAKKLVEAEYTGNIHLVFIYRGDEEKKENLLEQQKLALGMVSFEVGMEGDVPNIAEEAVPSIDTQEAALPTQPNPTEEVIQSSQPVTTTSADNEQDFSLDLD